MYDKPRICGIQLEAMVERVRHDRALAACIKFIKVMTLQKIGTSSIEILKKTFSWSLSKLYQT